MLGFLSACVPAIQSASVPGPGFEGPRFADTTMTSFDGAELGLSRWLPPEGQEPWAVIIALHGMNDYAEAWYLAGPWWASRGIATYAYDARGFGRSPNRGVWGGERLMTEDLRAAVALARRAHPGATVAVVGESMGAATILATFRSDRPVQADRVVLMAPAVWGWSNLPLPYRVTLWLGAHTAGARAVTPPRGVTRRIRASDNDEMLRRVGRDRNMLFQTRIDAVYGLVGLMERGYRAAGQVPADALLLYGARDQIVPRRALERTVRRLPSTVRTVEYPDGWHMLSRDLQSEVVFADVEAFLRDPAAPLPSGHGPVRVTSRR